MTGRARADLDSDLQLQLAFVRAIEVVGEAAYQVFPLVADAHPEVPWAAMIAMRHRLAHGYGSIDLDIVWTTVTRDLPPLIARFEAIAGSLSAKDD